MQVTSKLLATPNSGLNKMLSISLHFHLSSNAFNCQKHPTCSIGEEGKHTSSKEGSGRHFF